MSWTDERVEKLKELWSEGMSASQIALALGGVTRNAVIGKVHRLGLSNRTGPTNAGGASEDAKSAAEPVQAAPTAVTEPEAPPAAEVKDTPEPPKPDPAPRRVVPAIRDATQPRAPGLPTPEEEAARATLVEIEKLAKRLDLLELTERTCKWPIGDPTEDNFHFCGLQCVPGKPYCVHHVAIAFQPMSSRRDKNRAPR